MIDQHPHHRLAGLVLGLVLLLALPATGLAVDLATLQGAPVAEAEINQGTRVLVFWASWSPKCRDIEARAKAIEAQWGSKAEVVLVNFQEDAATVSDFLGAEAAQGALLDEDGSFAKQHSVLSLPGLLVLQDGKALHSGRLPADVDAALGKLLK